MIGLANVYFNVNLFVLTCDKVVTLVQITAWIV